MDFEHQSSTRRAMDAEALLRTVAAVAREEKRMLESADEDAPAFEDLSERELEGLMTGVLSRLALKPQQSQKASALPVVGTDVPFVDATRSRRRRTPLALHAALAATSSRTRQVWCRCSLLVSARLVPTPPLPRCPEGLGSTSARSWRPSARNR